MDISKLIRKKKNFVKKSDEVVVINAMKVRNQPAPTQNLVLHFIKENPSCRISDIYKGVPKDPAYIRKAIRMMVEGHRIVQRFTID